MEIKRILKSLIPIFVQKIIKLFFRSKYGWFGNYSSWEKANKICVGYDNSVIISKVKNATILVKEGKAAYERDSFIFNRLEFSFPLLSALLYVASKYNGNLNIIDFGGALGSTYFQNKNILLDVVDLKWNIIEQQKFIEIGKEYFEDDNLKFFYSINDCLQFYIDESPNVVLLSSVLQYLEKPYEFLDNLFSEDFKYILIDRTAFLYCGSDRITIQKVSPAIYDASYPAWFFDEKKFLAFFERKYELIYDFKSFVKDEEIYSINNKPAGYGKGFFFKLK